MSDPTSTPESVPEPTPGGVCPACGKALLWSETHRCPGPAASSPDEGAEVEFPDHDPGWEIHEPDDASSVVAGRDPELAKRLNEEKRLRCNAETLRSRPASADEGAPEGCEIDPVSSRGCERGTPGCVTQHADEGTRQRPDTATLRKIGAGTDGDGITLLTRAERAFLARAADWIDAQPDAAPPAPSTPAPRVDDQIRQDAAWIARLARGSSWPGEMAQSVEDACDRVALWAATPPSTPAEPEPTDG